MSADLEDSTEFKENGSDGSEPAHPEVVFWGANGRPMFSLFSVLISVLLWGGVSSAEQGGAVFTEHHVKVTVAMEGEGFMCPFLTPQFIDFLESRSHWVHVEPVDSQIQYAQSLGLAWSQEEVSAILVDIGYPEGGAVFLEWDTVAVLPTKPQP